MSSQTPPPGYYSGPGGSSQAPNTGFNGWKLADPNNITGVGNKGNAPPTDFGQAAAAQGQSNQQAVAGQTQANRPDQQTGFGGLQWTQGPDGQWTQTASLNPALSGALGSLQNTAAQNAAAGPFDPSAARNQAIQANYDQAASRLNPRFAQQDQLEASQLANQGLDPNSQAYRTAMQQYGQQKNDAYNQAMYSAIGAGNQTEQTQLGAYEMGQMMPYQQMGALQGYENSMPGFAAAGVAQPTPWLQAAEAAAGMLDKTNQQNQQNGADATSGAMGMIGTIFSDERLKEDIHRLPVEAEPGVPLATYRYKGEPKSQHHLGVIAQDLEKVHPEAVQMDPSGFKTVDYSQLPPIEAGGTSMDGPQAGQMINPGAPQGAGQGALDKQTLQAAWLRMTPEQRQQMFEPYQQELGIWDQQATPQAHTTAGGALMGGLGNMFASMDRRDGLKRMQADAYARAKAVYGDQQDPFAGQLSLADALRRRQPSAVGALDPQTQAALGSDPGDY